MLFDPNKSIVSFGDVVDAMQIIRRYGLQFMLKHIKFFPAKRSLSKWVRSDCSDSDFWILPQVQQTWNKNISGDENCIYEDYVVNKYLKHKQNLSLLSIGCGNSSHEQNFSRHACFASVEGIDVSEKQVLKAKKYAEDDGCKNLHYHVMDFENETIRNKSYDVILFHSSLHHFKDIPFILKERVLPIMKPGAILVLWEYTGANRLQWTNAQLNRMNKLLQELPKAYKRFQVSQNIKTKVYRPGLLRMQLSDPTEAIDSERLLQHVHQYFNCLEEKHLAGTLIHPLLKGIAQNFLQHNEETKKIFQQLIDKESEFVIESGKSDFTFAVFSQK